MPKTLILARAPQYAHELAAKLGLTDPQYDPVNYADQIRDADAGTTVVAFGAWRDREGWDEFEGRLEQFEQRGGFVVHVSRDWR